MNSVEEDFISCGSWHPSRELSYYLEYYGKTETEFLNVTPVSNHRG